MPQVRHVGILTALADIELPAVLLAFDLSEGDELPPRADGGRYWRARVDSRSGGDLDVVISTIGVSGNVDALLATERMISQFRPELIIFVGIAAGIECSLADVVVGSAIWAYQYVKTQPQGHLVRARTVDVPKAVMRDVQQASPSAMSAWRSLYLDKERHLTNKPAARVVPTLHKNAVIASGDAVMAGGELSEMRAKYDSIRAAEMEGYGFATGCENSAPPTPWLNVRGISDRGDHTKDGHPAKDGEPALKKDEYHEAAALAAATFARVFLEQLYSPPARVHSVVLRESAMRLINDSTSVSIVDAGKHSLTVRVERSFSLRAVVGGTYNFERSLVGSTIESSEWTKASLGLRGTNVEIVFTERNKTIRAVTPIELSEGDELMLSLSSNETVRFGRGFYQLSYSAQKDASRFFWTWQSRRRPQLDVFYCSEDLNATDIKQDVFVDVPSSLSGIMYIFRWSVKKGAAK